MKDFIQWTAPSPLWEAAIKQTSAVFRRAELSRPSILRFATDSFMDDFLQMLERNPNKLDQYVALPETWRGISLPPDKTPNVPAFARTFFRLGVAAKRNKAKSSALTQAGNKNLQTQKTAETQNPLKLYQPAHQRFYLVSACLVCERPGLPDKALNNGREEKVSFVLRRLFPKGDLKINDPLPPLDSSWEEHAFVLTDQGGKWKRIENQKKNSLIENEEQLPLFSVNFTEDDGRRRKLFAGMIPAGKREAYMAAGKASTATNKQEDPKPDSRIYLMRSQFRDPWKSLLQTAEKAKRVWAEPLPTDANDVPKAITARFGVAATSREQIQTISWLILIDFANFLANNLPRVWQSLNGQAITLNPDEDALKKVIENTKLSDAFEGDLTASESNFLKDSNYSAGQVKHSLKDALLAIRPANEAQPGITEKNLEKVVVSYNRNSPDPLYPKFLFPLADPNFSLKTVLDGATVQITPSDFKSGNFDGENRVNRIAQLIEAALPPLPANQPLMATPLAAQTPMDMREGFYIIRCVYERPLCGTIDPPVLSEPTRAFQIAGFFDPDAPARPIRIALPIDTTPAGLRKFDKNAAFMMSDLLCGQVNRMKGITFADLVFSILPFPFHKGLDVPDSGGCKEGTLSIGMICSLSIPIITICALILLIIIISLLDFIFKWLPFLMFCFPLPGLKGKK